MKFGNCCRSRIVREWKKERAVWLRGGWKTDGGDIIRGMSICDVLKFFDKKIYNSKNNQEEIVDWMHTLNFEELIKR